MNFRVTLFFISTFYLISGGILLLLPSIPKLDKEIKTFFLKGKFQVRMGVFGIICIVIFAVFPFDKIMLIGDLLPLISCTAMTLLFITGYIRISKHIDQKTLSRAEKILTSLQIPVGFSGVITGFIHIVFPGVIFL